MRSMSSSLVSNNSNSQINNLDEGNINDSLNENNSHGNNNNIINNNIGCKKCVCDNRTRRI